MAKATASAGAPVLICGEDDFAVKEKAHQLFAAWSAEVGGMDHEIIDAAVSNSGEALKVLGKLREALQTLPFFGGGKVIWLKNCNFLGEERAASAAAVTESLGDMGELLKGFEWNGSVRLLVSAGKVDKRKSFFKTLSKIGTVESCAGLSLDDKDWADQAERFASQEFKERGKRISHEALSELVLRVGPNLRGLASECEKLALYVGTREAIHLEDVQTIVSQTKNAKAFALGEAMGERNLPKVLKTLDEELWSIGMDSQRSEIGLLYGLISKIRGLLFIKELLAQKLIRPAEDFFRFKSQFENLPEGLLPEGSPLATMNAYPLFRAMLQHKNYSREELVAAMSSLLKCNQQLIFSSLDRGLILQQTLIQIVNVPKPASKAA